MVIFRFSKELVQNERPLAIDVLVLLHRTGVKKDSSI